MNKKKIIVAIISVIIVVAILGTAVFMLNKGHIKDTNGNDNYSLQQIADSNIIKMDVEALGFNQITDSFLGFNSCTSNKFSGVAESYSTNVFLRDFKITVDYLTVLSGNFKMVLVYNDEIVHEFKPSDDVQTYTIENPEGTISLRMAGESADFVLKYSIN